jgi:hypothetical protein
MRFPKFIELILVNCNSAARFSQTIKPRRQFGSEAFGKCANPKERCQPANSAWLSSLKLSPQAEHAAADRQRLPSIRSAEECRRASCLNFLSQTQV